MKNLSAFVFHAGKERLQSLTLFFAELLFQNASRSFFDEDKLPFAVFLMARYMVVSQTFIWPMICSYAHVVI